MIEAYYYRRGGNTFPDHSIELNFTELLQRVTKQTFIAQQKKSDKS